MGYSNSLMLTNPQKALLKRAQRQAELSDEDYRDILQLVTGCTSSTDPRLGDRHLDVLLSFFEAEYWRKHDEERLQRSCEGNAVFRQARYFWRSRNTNAETSRDRYAKNKVVEQIAALENEFAALGYGEDYLGTIRDRVTHGAENIRALHAYAAALTHTVSTKRKHSSLREELS